MTRSRAMALDNGARTIRDDEAKGSEVSFGVSTTIACHVKGSARLDELMWMRTIRNEVCFQWQLPLPSGQCEEPIIEGSAKINREFGASVDGAFHI